MIEFGDPSVRLRLDVDDAGIGSPGRYDLTVLGKRLAYAAHGQSADRLEVHLPEGTAITFRLDVARS